MNDPITLARQIATKNEISEAAEAWIVSAFAAWWRDGKDPERLAMFLRLPTASRSAVADRNYWLSVAASLLPEDNRAADLQRRCSEFMRKTWPAWRCSSQPPQMAGDFEAALFFAADAGANMQLCARQWRNIVRKSIPR